MISSCHHIAWKKKKFLSVQDSHYSEHIYYVYGYLIIVVIELSPKISCLSESASDGFIRCDGHVANNDTYPGVGLGNEGHHGSHFFNSKGVFVRHTQLQLWRGIKCIFAVIKELKGLFLTIKGINVFNTGAGGVVRLKRQKALDGLLKLGYD